MRAFAGTNKPEKIILHCSDSGNPRVNYDEIKRWHISRGFRDCGYAYVIFFDGSIFIGRPEDEKGAHCHGHNDSSIGICLHGRDKDDFTDKQFESLAKLLINLCHRYNFTKDQIFPHSHFSSTKTCPVFDVKKFKEKYL